MKEKIKNLLNKIPISIRYVMTFILGSIVTLICLFITACGMIQNIKPDSLPEEILEAGIENYIGFPNGSIDLTPSSPEN